jgi:hypothetical protein
MFELSDSYLNFILYYLFFSSKNYIFDPKFEKVCLKILVINLNGRLSC